MYDKKNFVWPELFHWWYSIYGVISSVIASNVKASLQTIEIDSWQSHYALQYGTQYPPTNNFQC